MGLIGSIFSGIFGSNAADKAATVQANASDHAADLEKQAADQSLAFNKLQYSNALNLMSPYYNMGTSAMGRLGFLMGLTPGQGLPQGVTDPNAPPAASGNTAGTDLRSILQSVRVGNGINGDTGTGAPMPMGANSAMLPASTSANPFQNNPVLPGASSSITQLQMHPPITSGMSPSGAAGMINPDGSSTKDVNPFPNGMPPATVNSSGVTNANGAPGTVPQTGGNTLSMNPPNIPMGEGGFGFPGQGSPAGSSTSAGDPGGFGSLAQNFGEKWQSPTGVTEVNDPGYQFRLQQGLNAYQNSAAARGKLVSGDTAKGLNDYAQNSASGEFQNVYNRALNDYTTRYNAFNNDQNTQFNRFATLAGLGQTSAGQLANVGLGTASNNANINLTSAGQIGQDVQNAGAARGSGYVGSANAITGAVNSGSNNIMQLLALMGGL